MGSNPHDHTSLSGSNSSKMNMTSFLVIPWSFWRCRANFPIKYSFCGHNDRKAKVIKQLKCCALWKSNNDIEFVAYIEFDDVIAARLVRRSVSGQVFRPKRYELFDSHEPLGQTTDVSYAVVESHGDQSVVHVQRVLGRYVQTKSRFAGVGEGHHHHVGSVTDVNSLDKQNITRVNASV